jgi:hypothetical protein
MMCNEGIPDSFYIQKASEYLNFENKTIQGLMGHMGVDSEKLEELRKYEFINNMVIELL